MVVLAAGKEWNGILVVSVRKCPQSCAFMNCLLRFFNHFLFNFGYFADLTLQSILTSKNFVTFTDLKLCFKRAH